MSVLSAVRKGMMYAGFFEAMSQRQVILKPSWYECPVKFF